MSFVKRITKSIPRMTSRSVSLELNDYSAGSNSFVTDDKFPVKDGGTNMWRLAQDARIVTLGEYETRKGLDFHSAAAGETMDASQTSIIGAADKSFSTTTRLAQKVTTSATGRLPRLDLNLKNDASATGTVIVEYRTNNAGAPGTLLSRSSIAGSDIFSSYAYIPTRHVGAPVLTALTDYWMIAYVQSTGTGSYKWSSTTTATNALISTDSGATWSATSYALNFRQYYCTDGAVKGLWRAYKADGTKVTLFVQGTTMYSVNDVTGALTVVKTGLNASATRYRYKLINDIVYYVNEYDGYRKWNFTTESQVSATNYSCIEHHKGIVWLSRVSEPTRVDYSNFGEYETFGATDFIYAIGPKTGDPVVALKSLNGYLIFITRNNKIIISGDDNATFQDSEAPDQKGTYTQETVTSDANFIYYLSDDGVYRSNGSEAQLLTDNNYEEIRTLQNKDGCVMAVNRGRLYLWYRSEGSAYNDRCKVWNLNYSVGSVDCVESTDTDAYVNAAFDAYEDDDNMLVGSSLIGQVYWQEKASNDYTNLGGDINYCLEGHYFTYGSPSVLKAVRYWLGRFGAQSGNYTIDCQYAYDLRDNWQTQELVNVQGAGSLWGSVTWGSFTWGTTAEVPMSTYIPGEYRRIAVRYKHYATRQPHKFLGHTFNAQLRRVR